MTSLSKSVSYGTSIIASHFAQSQALAMPVAVGALSAFTGAFIGKRLLQKMTFRTVQITVALAMLAIGAGLASGLV